MQLKRWLDNLSDISVDIARTTASEEIMAERKRDKAALRTPNFFFLFLILNYEFMN